MKIPILQYGVKVRDPTTKQFSDLAALRGGQGPQGATGPGVPAGGTDGDVLVKDGASDYAGKWSSQIPTNLARLNKIGVTLWTGDFSGPGTLTIPDLNSYRIVIYYNDSNNNYALIGTPYRGGNLFGAYGSTSITQFAYRFENVGNNTISIDQISQGISDGTHTTYANDSIYCHIYRVVGLIPV